MDVLKRARISEAGILRSREGRGVDRIATGTPVMYAPIGPSPDEQSDPNRDRQRRNTNAPPGHLRWYAAGGQLVPFVQIVTHVPFSFRAAYTPRRRPILPHATAAAR
jgi:hypothetical protein